jgi:hypothetical protein
MPSDRSPSLQSARVGVEGQVFAPTSPLSGIISYLSERCGGNVHDHHLVTITANQQYDDDLSNAAKNAADLTAHSIFNSVNEPNQWICYDFNRMKVKPTHYSIRSHYGGHMKYCNLKAWTVESSNDGTA